jgi:hypothetical protein
MATARPTGPPTVALHPSDAAAWGLRDDEVLLSNETGRLKFVSAALGRRRIGPLSRRTSIEIAAPPARASAMSSQRTA